MSWFKNFCAVCAVLFLTGCGFKPLYGSAAGVSAPQASFAAVEIANIPNWEGQFLRNALIDRIYAQNGRPQNAAYILQVSKVRAKRNELGVRKDATATHVQLRIETTMTLTAPSSGTMLLKRELKSFGAYNIFDSQYATMTAETAAREQALLELADQITQELALYFNRERK